SLALHQLIQSGDTLALAKLYDKYGENIVNVLRIDFADVANQDDSYLFEAVNEAFMGYYTNPHTFDPTQKTLKNFLILAAKRDLQNIIEKNKKHKGKLNLSTNVEVEENSWNKSENNTHLPDAEIIENESIGLVNKELSKHFNRESDIE
ncbi:sigma-70 family RNA polymerase sigma factor, partial [Acinetobacter baumannii]|uniref:RNA polymerase sigma factor n=1 Tax=Acinetobacter baumannii TaxID=470 RepID=UPI001C108D3B